MNNIIRFVMVGLVAASAHAGDLALEAGRDTVAISRTPTGNGIGLTADYLKHAHHGSAGGIGMEFAVNPGKLTLAGGGKLFAINADGSGTAALLGGRIAYDLTNSVTLFGQSYHAPSAASSGSIRRVEDTRAGVRWQALGPLAVEAGYRHLAVKRSDASRNRTLSDGVFVGAGLSF